MRSTRKLYQSRGKGVQSHVCFAYTGISLAMVCCTTRVDSRIPQEPPGSPRASHDSLIWRARRTRGRRTFVPTPLSKSWDDHVTLGSPTTMRPALWGVRGVPHRNFQQTFRMGYPPIDVSKASVLHIESHPRLGGVPPICGSQRGCSWTAGGAVLDGRVRSCAAGPRAMPGPLSLCSTGSF